MNELTKNQKIFIIIFLLIIVAVLGYTIWNFTKDNSNETEIDDLMINTNTENITNTLDTQATTAPSEKIIIYIIKTIIIHLYCIINIKSKVPWSNIGIKKARIKFCLFLAIFFSNLYFEI